RPLLRAFEENRQDRRSESRQAFTRERHRRDRGDFDGYWHSLADVQELRDPRPRPRRPGERRRRNPPADRARAFELDPRQFAVRAGKMNVLVSGCVFESIEIAARSWSPATELGTNGDG